MGSSLVSSPPSSHPRRRRSLSSSTSLMHRAPSAARNCYSLLRDVVEQQRKEGRTVVDCSRLQRISVAVAVYHRRR